MEDNKYFIKINSETPNTSPSNPKLAIIQDELNAFPDINKFVEDLIKLQQEKEKIIVSKSAEIESLKTLLTQYRNDANPLEKSVKLKELTRNLENEKKTLQENHLKTIKEKEFEINSLTKQVENLGQEKISLVHLNENLQQEFHKLQKDLSNTANKLKCLEQETENIQNLLQEVEAENQITKAKLTEYEQIGFRASERIQEVQAMTNQIRKESQDILELNRKSLQGMEETVVFNGFSKEEMHLDDEMKRLERIARKLEMFSREVLSKNEENSKKTDANIKRNDEKRKKTKDDLEIDTKRAPSGYKMHKKMMSMGFENTPNSLDFISQTGLTVIGESKIESPQSPKKSKKSILQKSKSFLKREAQVSAKKQKKRAKSFDSQYIPLEDILVVNEETFIKEMRGKIVDLIESCEKKDDKSVFFQQKTQRIRNVKLLFLKYSESLDKFYHMKIMKILDLSDKMSKISTNFKNLLKEKQTFEKNISQILNSIDGKEEKQQINNENYESYLSRLRRIIENSIYDQQSLKSQSLELNDLINENNRLKTENQSYENKIKSLEIKCEKTAKEMTFYERSFKSNGSPSSENEGKLEGLDDILQEIENENEAFLRSTPDSEVFAKILEKTNGFRELKENIGRNRENLQNILAQIKEFS